MRKSILYSLIFLPLYAMAQTITDKSGYTIDVTHFDEVVVVIANRVNITGDGYDELIITKGAIIVDGKKEITEKAVEFAKKAPFWIAFMRRSGFVLSDQKTKKSQPKSKVEEFMNKPKDVTTLTFNKQ